MEMELDERYILSMDEAGMPTDDKKTAFLGVSHPVKRSDTDSAICGSSMSSSSVSTRQKEKLIYDQEARSERRILARLDGGSLSDSSSSSSSSDSSSEWHDDDGVPDENHRLFTYLKANSGSSDTSSLAALRTDSLKRSTSLEDLQGIFDPDWDNGATRSSRRNRKNSRRRNRSSSRRSPTGSDSDCDEADKGESDGKLAEGLTSTAIPPLESHKSDSHQAKEVFQSLKDALDRKVARLFDKVRDGETGSIPSDTSKPKTVRLWAGRNASEEEAREEMATLHSDIDDDDADDSEYDELESDDTEFWLW